MTENTDMAMRLHPTFYLAHIRGRSTADPTICAINHLPTRAGREGGGGLEKSKLAMGIEMATPSRQWRLHQSSDGDASM